LISFGERNTPVFRGIFLSANPAITCKTGKMMQAI